MNKTRIVSGLVPLLVIATLVGYAEEYYSDLEDEDRTFVYTITEKPTAYQEADRLGIWFTASDFEPLGLYLSPDQPVEIDVRNIRGNSQPKILVGTYSRYTSDEVPTVYDLAAGSNTINDSQGGLLYLQFVTEETPSGKAEVTIDGGSPIPSYVLGESTHEEWLKELNTMTYEDVQYISNKTFVVVSKVTALKYKNEDQDSMLKTLDEVWEIEDYISGIDGSSELHKPNVHKILITELTEKELACLFVCV
jgi:DNA-binding beta-propeller fold protein YncE